MISYLAPNKTDAPVSRMEATWQGADRILDCAVSDDDDVYYDILHQWARQFGSEGELYTMVDRRVFTAYVARTLPSELRDAVLKVITADFVSVYNFYVDDE